MTTSKTSPETGARLVKGLVLAGVVMGLGLHAAWRYDRYAEADQAMQVAEFLDRHYESCVVQGKGDRYGCSLQALSLARELRGLPFRDRVAARLRERGV